MQKAGRELGMWSGARSEEGIEEDYEHELDHLHAAEVCGRGLVRVIVSIYRILDKEKQKRSWGWAPGVLFENYRTTRLGLALVSTRPVEPSETDLRIVDSLGYPRDLRSLAQKARDRGLPMPLSQGS